MSKNRIAVLGAGNMGCAIADGILAKGIVLPEDLILCRPDIETIEAYTEKGCHLERDAARACKLADTLILAVKPQIIGEIMESICPFVAGKLIISIAAGVTIKRIEKAMPGCPVVRVMPNTPLMVGCGVSALCKGSSVSDANFSFARGIFAAAGYVFECGEELLNPMTALTSSSIAYFARFIADMCAWAEDSGFENVSEKIIREMVCGACAGTAELILQNDMNPSALVKAVASPNGTTEQALRVFDETGFDRIVHDAMTACKKRADELSNS